MTSQRPSLWRQIGPGILLAATSIGASHLVLSPKAGAGFGLLLLWLVPFTHLFKYHAFEFGPRYAVATGESLVQGYARVPGPRGWALWIFLAGTIAQGVGVLAGVVGVTAAVLHCFVGQLSVQSYTALVIAGVLLLLALGGYRWLDGLNKLMMLALLLASVVVFAFAVPAPSQMVRLVIPAIPLGSIAVIAAIAGWMPTGIDVSIWHSQWTLEKLKLGASSDAPGSHDSLDSAGSTNLEAARRTRKLLANALFDMRLGYSLSFVVAVVFIVLGAIYMKGAGRGVEGAGFVLNLADIYVSRFGSWMFPIFMVAAFCAMFSTSYTVMDGFSRSFAETVSTLFPATAPRRKQIYWGFVIFIAVLALATMVLVGNPVTLVMWVAILSLAVAPLYCALNYYCVTRLIPVADMRPTRAARIVALLGVILMAAAAGLYGYSRLFL